MTEMHLGDLKKARDLMWTILNIKKLFVSLCHFCDLMSTGQDQPYCFNTVSFGTIKATLYEDY